MSGVVSRTVAAPFERLKILYQVQDITKREYKGIVSTLIRIGKEEGIVGYFRGNYSNIVRAIPYQSAQLVSYEKFKIFAEQMLLEPASNEKLPVWARLMCGGAAGCVSVLVSYPLDVVRARLSSQTSANIIYNGIIDALHKIYKQEGFIGLYRGLNPTLLGIAPYVAFNYALFEKFKTVVADYYGTSDLSVYTKLALGALSGTVSQTIAYPLDTVRRRMQMLGLKQVQNPNTVVNMSLIYNIKDIYLTNGIKGFYKGLLTNYLKVVPVVSINFVVYEQMKILLNLKGGGKEI